jgi:hypothetical protein
MPYSYHKSYRRWLNRWPHKRHKRPLKSWKKHKISWGRKIPHHIKHINIQNRLLQLWQRGYPYHEITRWILRHHRRYGTLHDWISAVDELSHHTGLSGYDPELGGFFKKVGKFLKRQVKTVKKFVRQPLKTVKEAAKNVVEHPGDALAVAGLVVGAPYIASAAKGAVIGAGKALGVIKPAAAVAAKGAGAMAKGAVKTAGAVAKTGEKVIGTLYKDVGKDVLKAAGKTIVATSVKEKAQDFQAAGIPADQAEKYLQERAKLDQALIEGALKTPVHAGVLQHTSWLSDIIQSIMPIAKEAAPLVTPAVTQELLRRGRRPEEATPEEVKAAMDEIAKKGKTPGWIVPVAMIGAGFITFMVTEKGRK